MPTMIASMTATVFQTAVTNISCNPAFNFTLRRTGRCHFRNLHLGRPSVGTRLQCFHEKKGKGPCPIGESKAKNKLTYVVPNPVECSSDDPQGHDTNHAEKETDKDASSAPQLIGHKKTVHPDAEAKNIRCYEKTPKGYYTSCTRQR